MSFQQEKIMDFDYGKEYSRSYYVSDKKSKSLFSCHLDIDKEINNLKKDSRRKTEIEL